MIINNNFKYLSATLMVLSTLFIHQCAIKSISTNDKSDTSNDKKAQNTKEPKEIKDSYFNPQEIEFINKTYIANVKTVRLYKKDWELGDPVIALGSTEQLELHWDILNDNRNNYQYRIYHCDKNWNKSTLNEMEYLDGFNDNYVEYSENSFNSQQNYRHYAVMFPNDQISFKKSGNYVIMVYQENNADLPILTRQFYVTEDVLTLQANVKYPSNNDDRYYKQEVDFNVFFNPQEIVNPYSNMHVEISQNHRPDNICKGLEPNFVKENQMVYNYDEETTFEGGNEFRHLDLTTHLQKTAQVGHFEYIKDTLHGFIMNDVNRQFLKYLQYKDINGRYIVKNLVGNNFLLESQYVMTHFTLPCDQEKTDGDVYIFGEISDNQIQPAFKMKYDKTSKTYFCRTYLKQGYYNYNYLFVPDNGPSNFETFEGTHFDTENDYIFKIYYSDPQNFYDRLLLYKIVNSRDTF